MKARYICHSPASDIEKACGNYRANEYAVSVICGKCNINLIPYTEKPSRWRPIETEEEKK